MPAHNPAPSPDVYDALFGDLPPGWRQRKGLPPEPDANGDDADDTTKRPGHAHTQIDPPPAIPGGPTSPWQLSKKSWIAILKRTFKEIGRDRVTSVSGGVTFFGLLALFPALTALVSIYGLVADRETILKNFDMLNRFLPPSAVDLIGGQVKSIVETPATALSLAGIVSILVALWSANGGMKALIGALNVAWFQTERRGFIMLNVVSLCFTLGAIVMIVVMLGLIAILPAVLKALTLGSGVETLVSLVRWPLMAGVLLLALAVIYRFGPSKDEPDWQWISPGAVFATVGLIVSSFLFSWYAENFANYNKTYGSLGAAVGLMMWLWIAAIVVMIGAELNSEAGRQIKMENGLPVKDEKDAK